MNRTTRDWASNSTSTPLDWSASVSGADAFVFVTPEYKYGYKAVLKNAIDYLHTDWADEAVEFLGYGVSGARTRSLQQLPQAFSP